MESSQLLTDDPTVLGGATVLALPESMGFGAGAGREAARTIAITPATDVSVARPWLAPVDLSLLPAVRPRRVAYALAKRAMDLAFCLVALPTVALLLIAIAIAIRIDSPGPILLRQVRVGRDGRRFNMYKFRSLRADYEPRNGVAYMQAFVRGEVGGDSPPLADEVNKPLHVSDMTRLGRVLRHSSLDELPQLWNVLKGEMSIVGPRPNVEWEVEAYAPWHRERLTAVPGITGLAQVRGRSWVSFDRIVLADIEYVRHQSLLLDLKILWWTIRTVFARDGAG
jgi:lipopolysaccharide/colanic/teichoic acid biosynthesis glycosyltransferase